MMSRARDGQVFILLAPGFEETDVSTLIRILRRSGLPVMVVGLTAGPIRGSYGLSLVPDTTLNAVNAESPRAIVLPGGIQGVRQLDAEPRVHVLLRHVVARGGYIVALDPAYTVLQSAGVLEKAGEQLTGTSAHGWSQEEGSFERVVLAGPVILGRHRGAAQEAASKLVALLKNR